MSLHSLGDEKSQRNVDKRHLVAVGLALFGERSNDPMAGCRCLQPVVCIDVDDEWEPEKLIVGVTVHVVVLNSSGLAERA